MKPATPCSWSRWIAAAILGAAPAAAALGALSPQPVFTHTEELTYIPESEETEPAVTSSVQVVLETAVIEGGMFLSPPVGRIVYFLRIKTDKLNKPFTGGSLVTGEPFAGETALLDQADSDQAAQKQEKQPQPSAEGWFDLSDKNAGFEKIEENDGEEEEEEEDILDDNTPAILLGDESELIDNSEMTDRIGLLSVLDASGNLFDDVASQLSDDKLSDSELENDPNAVTGQYFNFLAQSQFAALGIPITASGQGNYVTIQFLDPQGDADKSISVKRSLYTTNFKRLGNTDKDKFKWPPMQVLLRWTFAAMTALCLTLVFFGGGTEALVATLLFSSLTAITFINFSYFFPPPS